MLKDPSAWLVEHRELLAAQPSGRALDVACGRGRNALELARLGFTVDAVDCDRDALAEVDERAAAEGLAVQAIERDLERDPRLPHPPYRVIVNVNFLQRTLAGPLAAALAPDGLLVFETFTRACTRPMRSEYLLEPNELLRAFAGLTVLHYREGPVAGLVARRD
ncbi:MAG: methyltransferase domain-containing protein [Actinomycetota bacterium]|nr:methyltransferase domain-containing protein [Actinomycetota bacterium]